MYVGDTILVSGQLQRSFYTGSMPQMTVTGGAMRWWCTRYGYYTQGPLRSPTLKWWGAWCFLYTLKLKDHSCYKCFWTGCCQPPPLGFHRNIYKLMGECWQVYIWGFCIHTRGSEHPLMATHTHACAPHLYTDAQDHHNFVLDVCRFVLLHLQ